MKKIYDAVERFCARHPRFGIPNLMRYIVIGNVVVYFLSMLSSKADATALDFLVFNLNGLLHGEVWRLVTFVFVPEYFSPFALIISLYFYYWIGSILEREWGTAKFTLYYAGGALLTLLGVVITSLITGNHFLTLAGTGYVNLSMFLAFAVLFPNMTVLLFFIIPIKIKWLAIVDGVFFAVEIARSILAGNVVGIITPVLALLNFAIFITPHVRYLRQKTQYRHSSGAVNFRRTVHQAQQQQQKAPYHHKCAVCGRTDTDSPDLHLRYCSKCAGYHCFCQDHIFSHVHFTEE